MKNNICVTVLVTRELRMPDSQMSFSRLCQVFMGGLFQLPGL